jgi:hypothetical protein
MHTTSAPAVVPNDARSVCTTISLGTETVQNFDFAAGTASAVHHDCVDAPPQLVRRDPRRRCPRVRARYGGSVISVGRPGSLTGSQQQRQQHPHCQHVVGAGSDLSGLMTSSILESPRDRRKRSVSWRSRSEKSIPSCAMAQTPSEYFYPNPSLRRPARFHVNRRGL